MPEANNIVELAPYLRYWGKARPTDDAGPSWHPLAYHALDVAAVGMALLDTDPRLATRLAAIAGLDAAAARRWLFLALALHDLGKFAPAFQAKVPVVFEANFGTGAWTGGADTGHDQDGLLLWRALEERYDDLSAFFCKPDALPHHRRRAVQRWLEAAICHHGRPRDHINAALFHQRFQDEHLSVVGRFVADVGALCTNFGRVAFTPPQEPTSKRSSWLVAGIAVLADWIGSNQAWFPYRVPDKNLDAYWHDHAYPQASHAVRVAGVVPPAPAVSVASGDLLPSDTEASPLQRTVDTVKLDDGPQLYVIEDQTGAGKTEAALALAGRLIGRGCADGLFVALPTMATANAMYGRCGKLYRRLFSAGEEPSIVLAHSRRDLVLRGIGLEVRQAPDCGEYGDGTETASVLSARWLGDDRRKAALAACGVGTIDQAVLAVLPSRFQSLRLAGLARKVLVVDEVHAHDAYLRELVAGLLRFHAALGGSAILLSATLPARVRSRLIDAFRAGLGDIAEPSTAAEAHPKDPYPLLTCVTRKGAESLPVSPRLDLGRKISVNNLRSVDAAVERVVAAAHTGAAVCWIRNTVADVAAAFALLRDRVPTTLFHARFTMGDRLDREREVLSRFGKDASDEDRTGRVLVATQVAEHSLDLDFDAMVTDLAPMDSLIQRAGRLWRHMRPERTGNPTLYVYGPAAIDDAARDWYSGLFPGAAHVYPNHAALWLTARELERSGVLRLPEDARALVEAVYDEHVEDAVPAALLESWFLSEGEDQGAIAIARNALLPLDDGYGQAVGRWEDDTLVATRLGDPQTVVRLARWHDDRLTPWCEGNDWLSWRLSEVMVRRYWVAASAPLEPALANAVGVARTTWPSQRDDTVLVPLVPASHDPGVWSGDARDPEDRVVTLIYDHESGLGVVRDG